MDKVRWGMIGCGAVTEKKSGPGLYKAEHSELHGVFDLDQNRAKDYAARHHVPVVYNSVEQLLTDPEIDAVYLPTPPKFHKMYALKCIEAGKIPYVEKPMALCHADCEEILAAAKAKGMPVYVSFYRRGTEKFLKIKELLDAGAIGDVRFVDVKQIMRPEAEDLDREHLPWRLLPDAGGGKFIDMAVHVLDYLDYFFGNITEMTGVVDNLGGLYRVDDTVSASFRFANGVIGTGVWCYVAGFDQDEVVIAGSKGRLVFGGMPCGGDVKLQIGAETTVYSFEEPEHVAQPFIQTVVNELTGRAKSPADAYAAANGIKMFDRLLDAYRNANY